MRAVRLAGIACLVAVAVLGVLLARDVRSWQAALESGDAVYARNPAGASWTPGTRLGGLSESLLDVRGQVRFREALTLYRRTVRVTARLDNARSVAAARDRAQKALASAARDPDRQRASQALTLLGILAFGAVAQGGGQFQVDAAASDFTDAIRADPANEPAKYDLELLLRSSAAHGVQVRPGTGGGFGKIWTPRRRRRPLRARLLMTFLTPLGALAALAALIPLAAALAGRRRVAAARRALGLAAPGPRAGLVRPAIAAAGLAVLGLAAAQPVLARESSSSLRADVQAIFVVDTSRSMAASATRSSPTRLDRAVEAAVRLRAAIPRVAAGLATLTDRVLPDLLPVADASAFDGVALRAVAIERPPPRDSSVRATSFAALTGIATGEHFAPAATRRLVVLLTDGESNPFNAGEVVRALPAAQGYRFLAMHFSGAREEVFGTDGTPEHAYRTDPTSRTALAGLAATLGGRVFGEREIDAAASYLAGLAGTGPTSAARAGSAGKTRLAPYGAGLALLLVLGALWPVQRSMRKVGSLHR